MSDFGRELVRLMDERGLGVRELARAVYVTPGHISNLRNGKSRPSDDLAEKLAAHFRAQSLQAAWERDLATAKTPQPAATGRMTATGTRIVTAIADTTHADLADESPSGQTEPQAPAELLNQWDDVSVPADPGVLRAGQTGLREIGRLEEAAQLFRTWDHQHGGGLGRKAAVGLLSEVATLLTDPHPDPLRRRLLGVASQLALTIASMAADSDRMPTAHRYLALSLGAAREARDASMGARAVNAIARRVLDEGDSQQALDMLRHARRSLRDRLPDEMTALLYTTEAWTSATSGDYGQVAACLEQAASLSGKLGSLFGPAEIAGISGACYETLAVQVTPSQRAGHATRAEAHITEALRLRTSFYTRSRVLDLAGLANVRLVQGEPEEAMRVAGEALATATALRSDRATRRVHRLAIRGLDFYPDVPEVTEFAELVRSQLPVAPSR
jgi:transcriptional regulator with XRE-family HTH domain